MANRFARANGNFNHAIWASTPTGVAGSASTPTLADDVWANSFIVSLTGNVGCRTLNNGVSATSDGTSITGGSFLIDATTQAASITATIGINSDTGINGTTIAILSGSQNITLVAPLSPMLVPVGAPVNSSLSAVIVGGNNQTATNHTGIGVRSFCTNNTITILGNILLGGSAGIGVGLVLDTLSTNSIVNINGNVVKYPTSRSSSPGACVIRADSINSIINLIGDIIMQGGSNNGTENLVILNGGTLNHTGNFGSLNPTGNHGENGIVRINAGTYNLTNSLMYFNHSGAFMLNTPMVLNNGGVVNITTGQIIGGPNTLGGSTLGVRTAAGTTRITAALIQSGVGSGRVGVDCTGGTTFITCGNIISTTSNTHALTQTSGTLQVNSSQINNHADGTQAIYAASYRIDPIPTNGYIRYARNGTGVGSDAWLYQYTTDSLSAFSMPPVSAVRFGTTFANGTLTGTCAMPSPASVSFGVPVDNTTGTAILNPSDVFSVSIASLSAEGTLGNRLKNSATLQGVGYLIASFNSN